MTTGDEREVKCPHCRRVIQPPAPVRSVQEGQVVETTGICPRCGKENHFWARRAIRVDAEKASRVV